MQSIVYIDKTHRVVGSCLVPLPQWRSIARLLPLITLLVLPRAGWADDADAFQALKTLSLEQLTLVQVNTVVGASKYEQKISDAPANVTILTADDIKRYGWRTLGEALRSVSGMTVTFDRGYAYLGVRGVNRPGDFGGRTLITIDGHRMNDSIFDSAAMNTDFILDLGLVEKIEVIRGTGSSLYGNNAFFAVINIITRRGKDVNGTEVAGAYGTFDTVTGRVTYGNKFTNGVELLLSGTLYDSGGNSSLHFSEFNAFNNGIAKNMDGGSAKSAFLSLSWKDLTLEGAINSRMKRWPTAPYSTPDVLTVFNDPRFRTTDSWSFLETKFHHTFANDWELMARTYFDHYRFEGFYPFNYVPANLANPTVINDDYARQSSLGSEVQLSRRLFEKHRLTAGIEFREDMTLDQVDRDLNPPVTYNDSHEHGRMFAVYAEDEFQITTNLILNAGGRYDHFHTFGGTVNPRAAFIWHPWSPSTFKLLYGEAFRAPNAYEAYYETAAYSANGALKPETIRSYELIYEHCFNPMWSGKVSGFFNEISSLINLEELPDGSFTFRNSGSATACGLESELTWQMRGGLRGGLSYAFVRTRDGLTGNQLDNSPEHLAKFNLSVPLWREKIFASAEVQATSQRRTVNGGEVGAFWIANATIFSRELVKNLEMSVSVYNLFGQHYRDPVSTDFTQAAIEQDGRTLRVTATWIF